MQHKRTKSKLVTPLNDAFGLMHEVSWIQSNVGGFCLGRFSGAFAAAAGGRYRALPRGLRPLARAPRLAGGKPRQESRVSALSGNGQPGADFDVAMFAMQHNP